MVAIALLMIVGLVLVVVLAFVVDDSVTTMSGKIDKLTKIQEELLDIERRRMM